MDSLSSMNGRSSLWTDMKHYYPLNGNSNDLFGTASGTNTDMDFPHPKLGSGCGVFNGISGNIQTTVSTPSGAAPRSFSFWYNSLQVINRNMLGYGSYGSMQQFVIKSVGNSVYFDPYGAQYLLGTGAANTWHHVVVTYDGTTVRGYVDGVASTPVTLALNTGTTYKLALGLFAYPPSYQGCLDDVVMWDKALTAGEAASLYNSGNGLEELSGSLLVGVIHRYRMNGNALDSVGTSNGVATNMTYDPTLGAAMFHATPDMNVARQSHTATRLANGKVLCVGGAITQRPSVQYAQFNGSTSYIQTAVFGPLSNSARSASVWFKQPVAADEMLLGYGTLSFGGGFQLSLNGGQVAVDLAGTVYTFGVSLVNTWHHFVVTYDGVTLRGYLDGAEGTPVSESLTTGGANPIRIGWSYTGNRFTGSIDEIGTWSRALTYEEVGLLYAGGQGIVTYTGSLSTGLTHHWHLDTNSVDSVGSSGNGVDTDVTYLGGLVLSSCELYDPVAATWTATGSLLQGRYSHTAELLPSGKVLVVGGTEGTTYLASCELYDPAAGTWASTGTLGTARITMTAVLSDGRVMAVGGLGLAGGLASCEIYDPTAGTWAPTGSMGRSRYYHTATTLASGNVLAAGGRSPTTNTAEVYDATAGTWSNVGSMVSARYYHTATLLPSGKVLIGDGYVGGVIAELYDPTTGLFSSTGRLGAARNRSVATLLSTGAVLVTGGIAVSTAEIYTPATNGWRTTESMETARYAHTMTLLANNSVLVAGGYFGSALALAEIYTPGVSALLSSYATFNGSTAKIQTTYLGPSGAAPRSLSVWLKPSATQTKRVCGYGVASAGQAFQVYLTGGNVYVDVHGTTYLFGACSSGVWHHFCTTYDGTTLRGYVDGVAGTPVTVTLATAATGPFLMGGGPSGTGYSGSLDDVALYSRALVPAEVAKMYNSGIGNIPPF